MNGPMHSRDCNYRFKFAGAEFHDSRRIRMRTPGVNTYNQPNPYFSSNSYSNGGHRHLRYKGPDPMHASRMNSRPAAEPIKYAPCLFRNNANAFNGDLDPTSSSGYTTARWRQCQQSCTEPRISASSSQQTFEQRRDKRHAFGPNSGSSLLTLPEIDPGTSVNIPIQNRVGVTIRNSQTPCSANTQSPLCKNLLKTPNFPVRPLWRRRNSKNVAVHFSPFIIRTMMQNQSPVGQSNLSTDTAAKISTMKSTNIHTESLAPPKYGTVAREKVRATRKLATQKNLPEKSAAIRRTQNLCTSVPCTQPQLLTMTALERTPHNAQSSYNLDNVHGNDAGPYIFESMKLPVILPGEIRNSTCGNKNEVKTTMFSSQNSIESASPQTYSSNEFGIDKVLSRMAIAMANVLAANESIRPKVSLSSETDGAQALSNEKVFYSKNETDRTQVLSNEADRAQVFSDETDRIEVLTNEAVRAQLLLPNQTERAPILSSNKADRAPGSKLTARAQISPSKKSDIWEILLRKETDSAIVSSKLTDCTKVLSSKETDSVIVWSKQTERSQVLLPKEIDNSNVLSAKRNDSYMALSKLTDNVQVLSAANGGAEELSSKCPESSYVLSKDTGNSQVFSNETERFQVLSSEEMDWAQILSSKGTDRVHMLPTEIDSAILLSSNETDCGHVLSPNNTGKSQLVLSKETASAQFLSSNETDSVQVHLLKQKDVAQELPAKEMTKTKVLSSKSSLEYHNRRVLPPPENSSSKELSSVLLFDPISPASLITFSYDYEPISPTLELLKFETEDQCVTETNSLLDQFQEPDHSICNHYLNSESICTPESINYEECNATSLQGLEDSDAFNPLSEPRLSSKRVYIPPNFLIDVPAYDKSNSNLKEECVAGDQFYICTACHNSFDKEILLWVHLITMHSEDDFLTCPYCNLSVTKGMYIAHMKIAHFKAMSDLFGCGGLLNAWQCTYLAKTIAELTKHMDFNHSTESEFRCVKCNYFSASIRSYISHARTCKPLEEATVESGRQSLAAINSSWYTMSQLSKLVDSLQESSDPMDCRGLELANTNPPTKGESSPTHSTVEYPSPPTPPRSPCTLTLPLKRKRAAMIHWVPIDAPEVEVIKKLKIESRENRIDKSVGGSVGICPAVANVKHSRDHMKITIRGSFKGDTKSEGIKTVNTTEPELVVRDKDKKARKPFQCVYCGKSESCVDDVISHNKRRHRKRRIVWMLSDLRLTFSHDGTLLGGDFKPLKKMRYLCSLCSFRGERRSTVTKHITSEHSRRLISGHVIKFRKLVNTYVPDARKSTSEVTNYACNQCSYKTTTLFHFRLHMAHHDACQEKLQPVVCENAPLRCGTCGYFAIDDDDFGAHEEIHSHERRFLCGYCAHDDDTEDNVSNHIRLSHGLPALMYDRQILYNEMAREPQKMIQIAPKVILKRLESI